MVVNALNGAVSVAGIRAANIADGTVLLDIANPLDFSGGLPALFVGNDDSLGEQIQREFPTLRVVKSLNTMTAAAMVEPHLIADGDFTTFVSGNDDAAKAQVMSLLGSLGHQDVIDVGDITHRARHRGDDAALDPADGSARVALLHLEGRALTRRSLQVHRAGLRAGLAVEVDRLVLARTHHRRARPRRPGSRRGRHHRASARPRDRPRCWGRAPPASAGC